MRKKEVTILLLDEQLTAVETLAAESGISRAAVVRDAIEHYLAFRMRQRPWREGLVSWADTWQDGPLPQRDGDARCCRSCGHLFMTEHHVGCPKLAPG